MKSTLNYLTWSFALLLVAACGQKKPAVPVSASVEQTDTLPADTTKLVADEALTDAARFVAGLPVRNETGRLYELSQSDTWKA
nr:hypothetical protein [Bacteroides sp.]